MIEHIELSPNVPKEDVDCLFLPLIQFIKRISQITKEFYKEYLYA